MHSLRIVTLNTWKGDGAYGARLSAMVTQLAALDPDVITLQEAFEALDGTLSTPHTLATAFGMEYATYAMREKTRDVEGHRVPSTSGLCTLSRWPLSEIRARALPSDAADGDRGVLFVAVNTPVGVVRVANTHFTHLRGADVLRTMQAACILADPWLQAPSVIRLLCGDLNAAPDTETLKFIHSGSCWDVADACGPERAATLHDTSGEGRAIDYIVSLVSMGHAHPPMRGRVALDESTAGVHPSDHLAVCADITIGG